MKSKTKKEILSSWNEDINSHRVDFTTCPDCSLFYSVDVWAHTAVMLVLNPRIIKSSAVVVVSECPNCFAKSWIHEPMDSFDYGLFPEQWKIAVKEKATATRLTALRQWGASLCCHCKHLTGGKIDFVARRECDNRNGFRSSGEATLKCDRYEPWI